MFTNQFEAAEARVQEAERDVQEEMPAEQAQTILGWVLATRAGIAGFSGDIPHAISLARQALELLPEAEVDPSYGCHRDCIPRLRGKWRCDPRHRTRGRSQRMR